MSSRKPSASRGSQPSTAGRRSGPQRLQRILAAAGFGSRRACEELITDGRVEVDGEIVTELGTQVDPETSKIYVDGSRLKRQRPTYYLLNKPAGVVTTNHDPQGRPRVIDLIPASERLFPVGRLDLSSEGLILLTNDGELAQQLTHPRFGVRKIYQVTVAGHVTPETMKKMREGIYIAEGRVRVDGARIRKAKSRATDMEITLREGKNREIRRILARFGHKVQRLRRIAIGPLRLGELPVGAHRPLTSAEIEKLRNEMTAARKRSQQGHSGDDRATGKGGGSSAPKGSRKAKTGKKPGRLRKPTSASHTLKPPRSQQKKRAEFDLDSRPPTGGSQTTGAVIGGEPAEPSQPAGGKQPQRGERPSGRRGNAKGRGGSKSSRGARDAQGGKRSGGAKRRSGSKGKPRRKGS